MTPKISLVTVVAVALVAIPAAWGSQAQSNPRGDARVRRGRDARGSRLAQLSRSTCGT